MADGDGSGSSRWPWLGPTLGLLVGLAYGYGLGYVTASPYYDCYASPSPAIASAIVFLSGLTLALVIVPTALGIVYLTTARRTGAGRGIGCLVPIVLAIVGGVMGFALYSALSGAPPDHDAFCGRAGQIAPVCQPFLFGCR